MATYRGTSGADRLTGSAARDKLYGFAGDDTLNGRAGADTMNGGSGNDTYFVGAGDVLVDSGGRDTVISFVAGASLPAGFENLVLRGDFLPGAEGDSNSGTGNDLDNLIISQRTGGTILDGRGGDDTIRGGGGMEFFVFSGDYGHDSVDGGAGFDLLDFSNEQSAVTIDFSSGTLSGNGSGSATFTNMEEALGGAFSDLLIASDDGGELRGGAGDDTLIGGAGSDYLTGDGIRADHPESTTGDDSISGGGGDDFLEGGLGNDTLDGGAGNDRLYYRLDVGGYGNDSAAGGSGVDIVEMWNYTAVVVDLHAGSLTGGEAGGGGSVALSGIENFTAFGAGSLITGDAGANELRGSDGRLGGLDDDYSDTIRGVAGADTLAGGVGHDVLRGGGGRDDFVFDVAPGAANADSIADFVTGVDELLLDSGDYAAIGATGRFAAGTGRFYAADDATSGHDANDRVVYDTSSGALYYDADGSGAGGAQLIATLQGHPTLVASDITVI